MIYFFFNDTATTEIYTLSLHDALPIFIICTYIMSFPTFWPEHSDRSSRRRSRNHRPMILQLRISLFMPGLDRKSTRLNSSHANISYAVFCLKKKHLLLLFALPVRPSLH